MSLESRIEENTAAILALTAALLAQGATSPKPRAVAPAASGQTTAEVVKAAVPESTTSAPAPAAVSAAPAAPASTAAPKAVTYEQVAKAITECVKLDRAKVVAVLAQFGVKKGPELKPEQYAEFVGALA